MNINNQSNILFYRSAIELTDIFIKYADSNKLLQILNNLPISQDIIDYIVSLPKEHVGFAVGKLKKEPTTDLVTLRAFIDRVKEKENIKSQTQQQIANQLPQALKTSPYKNWFTLQFKKYPEKAKIVNDEIANMLVDFISGYNLNLSSYNLAELLEEMDGELGDMSESDNEIDRFFQQVKGLEAQQAARYLRRFDTPLFNWLKHSCLKLRKEWRKKIEKYMKDHNKSFGQILSEAQALLQAQQAGELRGQELPESPLHFPEHGALLNNLENISHWYNVTGNFDPSWSVSQVINFSKEWQHQEAAAGAGNTYDPIDDSRIVYGPDNWLNPEFKGYFIIELKSHNDLKTEGFKMNHCVGGYCDVVDRGSSRIFSLRHVASPMEPILTIETDPTMKVLRQDYGPNNQKVDKKFHNMVNEWNLGHLESLDPSTLSTEDLMELIYQSKHLPRKVIDYVLYSLNDEDMIITVANRCENLSDKDFMFLAEHPNPLIRKRLAENTNLPENIALKLTKDTNYGVREALAYNKHIKSTEVLNALLRDPTVIRILSSNPNLTNEMVSSILDTCFRSKNKNARAIIEELADHPSLDEVAIRKIFNMSEETFPKRLLNNPNLPVDIMEEALTWNNYEAEEQLTANPKATPSILDRITDLYLEENPTSGVVINVITNSSTSSQTIDKIFDALQPRDGILDYSSRNRDLFGIMAREAKNISVDTLEQILHLAEKSNDRYLIQDVQQALTRKAREHAREALAQIKSFRLLKFADKFMKKIISFK